MKKFVVTVQMNTDTQGHNPLCSLRDRGYAAYADNLDMLANFRQLEILGVEVTGPEEGIAFEVLASHPAVIAVYPAE